MTDQNFLPIGYKALVDTFNLAVISHFRWSYISEIGTRRSKQEKQTDIYVYDKGYDLGTDATPLDHLAFALKHEGLNLEIIKSFFGYISSKDVQTYIRAQPTGKYARMIWYLYESLTQKKLAIPDLMQGTYVYLLNSDDYYTATPIKQTRYRVYDNLLGNFAWCPFVRKTEMLKKFEKKNFNEMIQDILQKYSSEIQHRAIGYLYLKETRSSYAIEHEIPTAVRIQRFIELLRSTHEISAITKSVLITLQNGIVAPEFADADYRHTQNYVGAQATNGQMIHYISPKKEDVPELMEGLLSSLQRMLDAQVHPVIIATAVSFGFVYIHPFEDGNGRLHRFLIHYILQKTGFSPVNLILPISATMLLYLEKYDQALESFSKPLLNVLEDYTIDNEGKLTVKQETKSYYQYIDYTKHTEYLFSCLQITIDELLPQELRYLTLYDKAYMAIQNIVDMPNQSIDLFIKFVLQNKGQLSKDKQKKYFDMLTAKQIQEMEKVAKKFLL